jgi:endonuclease YncB( thermonuclease family)
MRRLILLLLVLVAMADTQVARAEAVTGEAQVINGDTIEVRGQLIRLLGIDAPESKQICERDGEKWLCSAEAGAKLRELIGNNEVRCDRRRRESYGRVVALCTVGDVDLGAEMVASGYAVAYRRFSEDYVSQEEAAKAAGKGLWAGTFVLPWEWRDGKRLPVENLTLAPAGCAIKGDIGKKGERIYHMPGGAQYGAVVIDTKRGERWFCSEAEAKKAGWKRAPK